MLPGDRAEWNRFIAFQVKQLRIGSLLTGLEQFEERSEKLDVVLGREYRVVVVGWLHKSVSFPRINPVMQLRDCAIALALALIVVDLTAPFSAAR
jgi:hypothetical protein